MSKTITKRQNANKMLLLEQLKRAPIVQVACEKVGISRATYYRWRKKDKVFLEDSDKAILNGNRLVNDLAESQLITAIKNNSLGAIVFWLKHHHPNYTTRVELLGHIDHKVETITPEQEQLINKALKMAQELSKHPRNDD
jgi:hypothetical protein